MTTDTVPCTACGNATAMTGTKLCDPCWEASKNPIRTYVDRLTTDLSKRLRDVIADPMWANHVEISKTLLTSAADEIDRYYTGMVNWKKTAENNDMKYMRRIHLAEDALRKNGFTKLNDIWIPPVDGKPIEVPLGGTLRDAEKARTK